MQLENITEKYQPTASQERQISYFVVGDLESLSASVLYEKIRGRDYLKSNDRNLNFYNLIKPQNFGETELGIQEKGESHKTFKKRIQSNGGYRVVPTIIQRS